MQPRNLLLVIFLLCGVATMAQPVYSPEVRAQREAEWMQDSLHLSAQQLQKAKPILLTYQQQMDKSNGDDKKQHQLMQKKDAHLKAVLNKQQYKKYYRREKQIRALPKPNRTGPHQAY